jgi:fructokinase
VTAGTDPVCTVVGEALLDLVQPGAGDLYRALPAGGPLNIAVGLQRLGHPTALMARLSTTALGARVRAFAEGAGLDLTGCIATDEQPTLAFATVDELGRASYDFYVADTADWGWTADELTGLPASTQVVHTGSLATAVEPAASVIALWWARLAARGDLLLSFDPNVRSRLGGERPDAVARVERFVGLSHVVKASDEDLGWLYPDRDPVDSLRDWSSLGPELVVLTRGAAGCVAALGAGAEGELAAPPVVVSDTIGAGDSFHAGLLSGLLDEQASSPAAMATLTEDGLTRVLRRALGVAAVTCSRPGADPPTRDEYERGEIAG